MSQTYATKGTIHHQALPKFRYPVCFTEEVFAVGNSVLADVVGAEPHNPGRSLLVVDSEVAKFHPKLADSFEAYCRAHSGRLKMEGPAVILPGGEAAKTSQQVEMLHEIIYQRGLCRHSYVVIVGGGAVLDAAGYAAATAHRGLRVIRIPTTVLAQNDAGIGVKNGINAFGRKNFLGSFAPPHAVVNDFGFLATLHDRDWRAGIAEAIKVGLIRDAEFFDWIQQNARVLAGRDAESMRQLIFRCAQLHLEHMSSGGDPFEQGSSRPLDFGHWSAHKLEQVTHYHLRHGEAVAIGIALDVTYSWQAGLLGESQWQRVINVLKNCGLPIFAPALQNHLDDPAHADCILRGLEEFREHLGGELTLVMLKGIGSAVDVHSVDEGRMKACVRRLAEESSQ